MHHSHGKPHVHNTTQHPCVGSDTWLTPHLRACVLQAPLFGMLSWVNSSEVRRWLQTKIADPQTLRSSSAQDNAFANPLSRHNSDVQLAGGQDGMPGLPTPSHHSDNSWVSHSMPFNTSHRSRNPVHALSHTFASAACAP